MVTLTKVTFLEQSVFFWEDRHCMCCECAWREVDPSLPIKGQITAICGSNQKGVHSMHSCHASRGGGFAHGSRASLTQ
eukprot:5075356-Amphidinium_carterae.1